ncbi:hypothetical protein [Paracoccus sp. (in: a-proteobacteria)]|uniref:hypothetical protein n=1 Tax=Paracoccus sp. TaxID=267 RepID=UPI0026DF48A0|nr:hypothetical protein [Paracoccus sp. (in: a-proteobacteria)]MDO5647657.1 hypothetical protein [Paracoccus sp. (in: a-proteobacteria)]
MPTVSIITPPDDLRPATMQTLHDLDIITIGATDGPPDMCSAILAATGDYISFAPDDLDRLWRAATDADADIAISLSPDDARHLPAILTRKAITGATLHCLIAAPCRAIYRRDRVTEAEDAERFHIAALLNARRVVVVPDAPPTPPNHRTGAASLWQRGRHHLRHAGPRATAARIAAALRDRIRRLWRVLTGQQNRLGPAEVMAAMALLQRDIRQLRAEIAARRDDHPDA